MTKKIYVVVVLLLLQFVLSSCASTIRNANIETMQPFRDLCPDKKVSICYFELSGADASKNAMLSTGALFGGLVGGLVAVVIAAGHANDVYSQELTKGFHHVYEEALGKSGFFQLSSTENLLLLQDGKTIKLDDMAKKNNLYACVNAVSLLGVRVGFSKRVQVTTAWEITRPSGEKFKFTTQAISDEGQGVFPDKADPKFKPLFLELARQNVQQFLDKLGESGETGSCLKDSLEKKKASEEKRQEIEKAVLKEKDDSRFINKGNGTVLDTRTNLMWAAKDNGSDIKWADAKNYCENYRGGGYTDWRMPTVDELKGLYDAGKERPTACNKSYSTHVATDLIDVTCYFLWASETRTRLGLIPDAYYFYFIDGGQYWGRQSGSSTYRVLPVRSGK